MRATFAALGIAFVVQFAMVVMLFAGTLGRPSCGLALLASLPLLATLAMAGGTLLAEPQARLPARIAGGAWAGLQIIVVAGAVGTGALAHQLAAATLYALVQAATMIVVVTALGSAAAKRHFGR